VGSGFVRVESSVLYWHVVVLTRISTEATVFHFEAPVVKSQEVREQIAYLP